MLIFNGKTYFVPFIGSDKVAGAEATPDQVEEGVKFAGANGVVEEGRLPFYDGEDLTAFVYQYNNEYAYIQSNVIKKSIIEDVVYSKVLLSQFGNATAADVRAGVRFTSAEGYDEEGEMPTIALPEATIHFDVDSGRILSVVTNNEDGFVEKGETSAYTYLRTKKAAVIEPSNTTQIAVQKNYWTTGDVTVAPIPDYYIDASDMSVFGNATAADVRKGKSFTSADGVNEEGTMEAASLTNGTGWYRNANYIYVEPYVSKGYSNGIYDQWYCDARTLDANLIPANIAEGTSIFGITGTHKGGSEIKTCKLTVTRSTTTGQSMITATTFDGTNFVPVTLRTYSGTDTIENVVCGSVVQIQTQYMTSLYGWAYGKSEMGNGGSINIPNETGDYTVDIGALDD